MIRRVIADWIISLILKSFLVFLSINRLELPNREQHALYTLKNYQNVKPMRFLFKKAKLLYTIVALLWMHDCDLVEDNDSYEESNSVMYRDNGSSHKSSEGTWTAIVSLLPIGFEAEVDHYEWWVYKINGKNEEAE